MNLITLTYLFLADYLIYGLIALLPYLWFTGEKTLAFKAGLGAVLVTILDYFLKDFFYFHRPFVTSGVTPLAGYLADGSFPSNHTAVAFSIAVAIGLRHHRLGLLAFILAALVGLGRILGGVHYPLDVVAGALLGSLVAILVSHLILTKYHSE